MPRKPRSTATPTTGQPATAGPATRPLELSPSAQELHDRIAAEWELSPATLALLRAACEALTMAQRFDEITTREGLTIPDGKGAAKPHPAATLARDYRAQHSTALQRLLSHLGG